MDIKTRPIYMLLIRKSLQKKGHTQTKSERMEKIFHENGNKKAEVAILISDKIDFKTKIIIKDKKGITY